MPTSDTERREIFVNGAFARANTVDFTPVVNPATEQTIGSIPAADGVDVGRAVDAARAALPGWRATPPQERGAMLAALAERYDAEKERIAELVTRQNGTVVHRSLRSNGDGPVAAYRSNADLGATMQFESIRESGSARTVVMREPIGVVGSIVPWNVPQGILALHLAPALLAGCTIVVKPSPETSLDAYALAEMVNEAGIPPGVVNIVPGGASTGQAMVRHPHVAKISFTGSTATGREVARTGGEMLKSVTAELGGKSAAILLDDADLDTFASELIATCLANTGQACVASTRVLAPRSRLDDVLDVITSVLDATSMGDPMDTSNEFGPLVSARQRARVEGYIAAGVAEGARLIVGGGRPPSLPIGFYVLPTVFADVTREMSVFREEIFGPVLVVVAYDGADEAVAVANDSEYGLSGSVFSRDVGHAAHIARQIETGTVRINGQRGVPGVEGWPFKNSGISAPRDVNAYLQTKVITHRI